MAPAPTSSTHNDPDGLRHRALADASRRRLLATLLARGPLGVRDLAAQLGLHENTVRAHVRLLLQAGLVTSEAEQTTSRGRPRAVFRAAADALTPAATRSGAAAPDDVAGERHFQLLAEILTAAMAQGATDPDAIAQVAEAWGHYITQSPAPFSQPSEDAARMQLMTILDELGFQPRLERRTDGADGDEILMTPCPFIDLARRHQEVVCPIHLGLMRGALAHAGARSQVEALVPFATPTCCRAVLTTPAE